MAGSLKRRVAVIGGGIFGVSSALHLACLGVEVTLITDGPVASGASSRSLAWLNSARYRSRAYHDLRMAGIDRYHTLAHVNPSAKWLRFDGALTWDADEAKNEIDAVFAYETSIGYAAVKLEPDQIAAVTPGVDPTAVTRQGAIFNPSEGWVDLPSLIRMLLIQFEALGGRLVTNAGKARVLVEGGCARGAVLGDGSRIESDAVLLATGPSVPQSLSESGIHLPDQTPIALLVKTKPHTHPLRAVLNTPHVAVRPTPDGAFVLDSAWSEEGIVAEEDGTHSFPAGTTERLLEEASAVLEGRPRLELESYAMGPKPIPADGDPVFGELAEISGYFVAFSHSGATLGLIAGEMLAREIATGEPSPMLALFRPARFANA